MYSNSKRFNFSAQLLVRWFNVVVQKSLGGGRSLAIKQGVIGVTVNEAVAKEAALHKWTAAVWHLTSRQKDDGGQQLQSIRAAACNRTTALWALAQGGWANRNQAAGPRRTPPFPETPFSSTWRTLSRSRTREDPRSLPNASCRSWTTLRRDSVRGGVVGVKHMLIRDWDKSRK